jgi:hypothetical protein
LHRTRRSPAISRPETGAEDAIRSVALVDPLGPAGARRGWALRYARTGGLARVLGRLAVGVQSAEPWFSQLS